MGKLSSLFEEKPYEAIRETPPELAYQLYLLDLIVRAAIAELAGQKQYVRELATYGRFSLFTVCTKTLKAVGAAFGEPKFSKFLEQEWEAAPTAPWRMFCKLGVGTIRDAYKTYGARYRKQLANSRS